MAEPKLREIGPNKYEVEIPGKAKAEFEYVVGASMEEAASLFGPDAVFAMYKRAALEWLLRESVRLLTGGRNGVGKVAPENLNDVIQYSNVGTDVAKVEHDMALVNRLDNPDVRAAALRALGIPAAQFDIYVARVAKQA